MAPPAPPETTGLVTSKINHNVENVKLKLQNNIYWIGLNQLRYVSRYFNEDDVENGRNCSNHDHDYIGWRNIISKVLAI